MSTIPDDAKRPQDRKAKMKAEPDPGQECFEFEAGGRTYRFAPTVDVLTPGFIRRNRGSQVEFQYALIEGLAGEDALAALDSMSLRENADVMRAFDEHVAEVMKVSLGESSGSTR